MRIAIALFACGACFSMPARPIGDADSHPSDTGLDASMGGGDGSINANIAFVTSQPLTGSVMGQSGADNACTGFALAAGFPGTYVAWLATAMASAPSRLGSARGWVRPDGLPIADTVADLTAGRIFYPIAVDDAGSAHYDEATLVLTGAQADGTATPNTCMNYMSTLGSGTVGYSDATTGSWTFDGVAISCGTMMRMYCFATDKVAPIGNPTPPPHAKLAFVTTGTFLATGGLLGADALCASEAGSSHLTGTFVALLATTTASAASRVGSDVYVRTDGVTIGAIGGSMKAPINVTAAGDYLTAPAWTGASSATSPATSIGTSATTCANWTATTGTGEVGAIEVASALMYFVRTATCSDSTNHLYCVQQ
jgi:hypothetical protein